jgi:hypothetical protein
VPARVEPGDDIVRARARLIHTGDDEAAVRLQGDGTPWAHQRGLHATVDSERRVVAAIGLEALEGERVGLGAEDAALMQGEADDHDPRVRLNQHVMGLVPDVR